MQNIPLTKTTIAQVGDELATTLLDDGLVSPLEALIKLRAMRDVVDRMLGIITDYALEDATRMLDDDKTLLGVGVQLRNGRTIYAYDHDPVWAYMKAC